MVDRPARDSLEVVRGLLAVQGQDARRARLAIRARSEGLTAADVDRAPQPGSPGKPSAASPTRATPSVATWVQPCGKLPVAITDALHCRLTPTKADQGLGQDYEGRLWDVLWLAAFTIKLADRGTDNVTFTAALQEAEAKSGRPQNIDLRLRAVCGPDDEGEPVITIGFPEDF